MKKQIYSFIKEVLSNTRLRSYYLPKFSYNFTASQLCALCKFIEDTRSVEGAIAEIGCFNGSTTVFLNKYIDAQNIEKKYYALDTFKGFVVEDIAVEVGERSKSLGQFTAAFTENKKKWFDGTMKYNNIKRVISIESDVNKYDLTSLAPLSFVLLDVDLYRPIKKALPELYKALSPNGIIVVDDCYPLNDRWDGADQAYKEFMKEINQPYTIIQNKLGVITKKI